MTHFTDSYIEFYEELTPTMKLRLGKDIFKTIENKFYYFFNDPQSKIIADPQFVRKLLKNLNSRTYSPYMQINRTGEFIGHFNLISHGSVIVQIRPPEKVQNLLGLNFK
jgi:hypothetical protein